MADLDLNRAFRDYHYAREHLIRHAMGSEFIYDCREDPPGPPGQEPASRDAEVREMAHRAQDLARLACAVTNQDGYRHPAPIPEQVTQLEALAQALNRPFETVPNRLEEDGYYRCPTCDGEGTLPAEQVTQYHQGLIGAQVYGFGEGIEQLETWLHHGPEKTLQLITEFKRLQTENQKLRDDRELYEALHQETAKELLAAGKLARSEKALGWAKWLQDLAEAIHPQETRQRNNGQIWRAVAEAPKGWCQVRSGMLGTLLDDLKAGLPFGTIKARWDDKMGPMQYMRPTAAPTDGAIERAEKIFAELGLAPALERRFARLHEVWDHRVWAEEAAKPAPQAQSGLFGHLRTARVVQQAPYVVQPVETVTWSRFRRSILPMVQKLDVRVGGPQTFVGLLTATHPEAPPILQWDSQEARNPFSWYVYQGGSLASQWGLTGNSWVACPAVVPKPSMWSGKHAHQGEGMIFVLDGCRETRESGLALFPEILRSDLHEVRKVIEAHSRTGQPTGADEGSANGLLLDDRNPIHVRVHLASGVAEYKIERWD